MASFDGWLATFGDSLVRGLNIDDSEYIDKFQLGEGKGMVQRAGGEGARADRNMEEVSIAALADYCQFQDPERRRKFELLRLALFALKLRKLERTHEMTRGISRGEYEFRCKLLRHGIFQQVLVLISLGAREQTRRLITACFADPQRGSRR